MRSPPWSHRLAPARFFAVALLLLALAAGAAAAAITGDGYGRGRRLYMRNKVLEMFYHAYDNYMTYAFPHDELKPLTKSFTDSLSELGNLNLEHLPNDYNGSALTLVESLSSLVVLGNLTEFERGVLWLSENLTFDVDARINLFECNIRLLGGLISGHILAKEYSSHLKDRLYQDQLLHLAENLGSRFLPAFETPTGLPYAWINLKHGVMENETTETSTSGCGSLILEMGALSRLTGDSRYEAAALRALRKLWSMRSSLNLVGTTLDVLTGKWIEYSSGIGAGVDSFYEYLIKAYVLFGSEEYWDMFHSAYLAVQKYFRHGPWYHEADMRTGEATHWQLTSLQAFWPGLQVCGIPYMDGLSPYCRMLIMHCLFTPVIMPRHFWEMLLLQIYHIVNFTMYGKGLVCCLKDIFWTLGCCILQKSIILYVQSLLSLHFIFIKQLKILGT
ncbi:hypothetical protein E2562_010473 [Oryza meyeriana var. granulata]|uniref:alpha-1,2-Mannosidase n=1 Tax=Oryza meyeriana var. granulata TaxID=110450 RepID=A0A6G1F6Q1_9ORYZ|nr:hypothetical protein E2562_010473 [Oryza meyeriana var. granulata]KAF0932599.1 hypothetical protein E2562_010473 [Oryza meyeriana var. granulata]